MRMRQYLLVLDMDLLAVDEQLSMEPINYLVSRQEQEQCEVVVLSLAGSRQARLPAMELLLGARAGKFPVAPRPDHDLSAAAEHRMNLAVQHLKTIGCQASGLISDEDLLPAGRAEAPGHDHDEGILAIGRERGRWLARALHPAPGAQLRRTAGPRLTGVPPDPA